MYENLIEHIRAAEDEAIRSGIKKNTLIVGKNLALSRGFFVKNSFNTTLAIPPLVLGLRTAYANEKDLPDDVSFIIGYSRQSEELQREEETIRSFSQRAEINFVTLIKLEETKKAFFLDKNHVLKEGIIDSIDIINRTVTLHEEKEKRFRVRKYDCYVFAFNKYGKEFSLAKEELEC